MTINTVEDLDVLLRQDRVLFVITGLPASGKTTLAKRIADNYNHLVFSLDAYKVREFEKQGFSGNKRKLTLQNRAVGRMQKNIREAAKFGIPMIAEASFTARWQPFFGKLCHDYKYKYIVIKCYERDKEQILNTMELRYTGKDPEYPKCLLATSYLSDKEYLLEWKGREFYMRYLDDEDYIRTFTALRGNTTITDTFVYSLLNEPDLSKERLLYTWDPIETLSRDNIITILRQNRYLLQLFVKISKIIPVESLFLSVVRYGRFYVAILFAENITAGACDKIRHNAGYDFADYPASVFYPANLLPAEWKDSFDITDTNYIPAIEVFPKEV